MFSYYGASADASANGSYYTPKVFTSSVGNIDNDRQATMRRNHPIGHQTLPEETVPPKATPDLRPA